MQLKFGPSNGMLRHSPFEKGGVERCMGFLLKGFFIPKAQITLVMRRLAILVIKLL